MICMSVFLCNVLFSHVIFMNVEYFVDVELPEKIINSILADSRMKYSAAFPGSALKPTL